MVRTMDDRPVPGDQGMEDRPRPPMNALGVFLRREVLDHRNAPYKANFDNDTITVLAVRDFVEIARWYGRETKQPQLAMTLGEEELTYDVQRQKESIRLRLAGDAVSVLLRTSNGAFRQRGGQVWFDIDRPINLQAVLRALANLDQELR